MSETQGVVQKNRKSNVFFLMPIDYKPAVWRSGFKDLHRVWAEYIEEVMGS